MKLTRRSEYALLALIYLAREASSGNVPLTRVAKAQGIPARYLEQLFAAMCHAGYMSSSKGQHGGYRLARPADQISLAAVIRLFDGALAPVESVSRYFYRTTPLEKEEKLVGLMREVRDYISQRLEATTIADLV